MKNFLGEGILKKRSLGWIHQNRRRWLEPSRASSIRFFLFPDPLSRTKPFLVQKDLKPRYKLTLSSAIASLSLSKTPRFVERGISLRGKIRIQRGKMERCEFWRLEFSYLITNRFGKRGLREGSPHFSFYLFLFIF